MFKNLNHYRLAKEEVAHLRLSGFISWEEHKKIVLALFNHFFMRVVKSQMTHVVMPTINVKNFKWCDSKLEWIRM
jgi:hypothetical protein